MKDIRSRREKSLQKRMKEFCTGVEDVELFKLGTFFSSSFVQEKPNKLQLKFIKDFFGEPEWKQFVETEQTRRDGKAHSFFKSIDIDIDIDFDNIRNILSFEILLRFGDSISKIANLKYQEAIRKKEQVTLKLDLAECLIAPPGETFNKVDGFSDLYETLIKHKLVTES